MNQKEKLVEVTMKELSKINIDSYSDNLKSVVSEEVNSIIQVLQKYASNITTEQKKVNTIISCKFNVTQIPDKDGNLSDKEDEKYFEIPEDTFNDFITDLKSLGFRQYGSVIWNDFLIPFNNASLTGVVTLLKQLNTGNKLSVKVSVRNISTGFTQLIISVK